MISSLVYSCFFSKKVIEIMLFEKISLLFIEFRRNLWISQTCAGNTPFELWFRISELRIFLFYFIEFFELYFWKNKQTANGEISKQDFISKVNFAGVHWNLVALKKTVVLSTKSNKSFCSQQFKFTNFATLILHLP